MLTILLYTLVGYLLLCYGWGLYVALRIYTGRRLRQVIRLQKPASRIAMATGDTADAIGSSTTKPAEINHATADAATPSSALPASRRRKAAA